MTNLEKIHFYMRDFESPEMFITWNYLYMIASTLGRKVYFQEGAPVYPNIFVVFVAPPAVGKSMPAKTLGDQLRGMVYTDKDGKMKPVVNIMPQCCTLERLYEILAKSIDFYELPADAEGKVKKRAHSSVSFLLADEMALLFKRNDKMNDLVMFLNGGYDCMSKFEYEIKHGPANIITNMCVNFLGCCTPSWVSSNVSSSVIDDGWASRVFFIYADDKRQLTTYYKYTPEQTAALEDIKLHIRELSRVCGEVTFTAEAEAFFHDWYQNKQQTTRVNRDSKLDSYYSRKKLHIWKLSMLCHFMQSTTRVITLDDVKMAFRLAGEAELTMHKALASINHNPTAKLAEDILRFVKGADKNSGRTRTEIVAKVFNQAMGGLQAIDQALEYLRLTDKLELKDNKWREVVKIVKFPVGETTMPEELISEESAEAKIL